MREKITTTTLLSPTLISKIEEFAKDDFLKHNRFVDDQEEVHNKQFIAHEEEL